MLNKYQLFIRCYFTAEKAETQRGERSGPPSLGEPVASDNYQKCHLVHLKVTPSTHYPVSCAMSALCHRDNHTALVQESGGWGLSYLSASCVFYVALYHLGQQPAIYHLLSQAPFYQRKLRMGEVKEPAQGARS